MRIELQHRLDLGRQAVEAAPHIRHAARQIDPDMARHRDHDSADKTRRKTTSLTSPMMRNFTRLGSSTSITPPATGTSLGASGTMGGSDSTASARTETGTNPVSSPARNCLRQVESWSVLIPRIRHARLGDE